MSEPRTATVERNTNETQIKVSVNLDGTGIFKIESGLPFLEHMLEQVARHGLVDIDVVANGDLEIDAHHTVEDLGITLGQAFDKALAQYRQAMFILLRRAGQIQQVTAVGSQNGQPRSMLLIRR